MISTLERMRWRILEVADQYLEAEGRIDVSFLCTASHDRVGLHFRKGVMRLDIGACPKAFARMAPREMVAWFHDAVSHLDSAEAAWSRPRT